VYVIVMIVNVNVSRLMSIQDGDYHTCGVAITAVWLQWIKKGFAQSVMNAALLAAHPLETQNINFISGM
jgi:hypothetical protein